MNSPEVLSARIKGSLENNLLSLTSLSGSKAKRTRTTETNIREISEKGLLQKGKAHDRDLLQKCGNFSLLPEKRKGKKSLAITKWQCRT